MATIYLDGTKFSFEIAPLKRFASGYYANVKIYVGNEHISYQSTALDITREDLENWLNSMSRLLAGAYASEYNIRFERAKFSVDLYPHTQDGKEVDREARRRNDCIMAISLLMQASDTTKHLGGVYTLLLHRQDIQAFVRDLRKEFECAFARILKGKGKYLFVGVSPFGYEGCNYWYFDPSKTVEKGDYVWVRMGRHNKEQIVFVDSVRQFSDDTAPYNPAVVKQVLCKATKEEVLEIQKDRQ